MSKDVREIGVMWTPSKGSQLVCIKPKKVLLGCVKRYITDHKYQLSACNNMRYELRLIQSLENIINGR